jgi:hypothetical protein
MSPYALTADELEKTYEGKHYSYYRQCNGQQASELEKNVKMLIAENNLTATVSKGFLEYMKLVIDGCSYLPKEK